MISVLLFKISMTMLVLVIFSHGIGIAIWGNAWKRYASNVIAFCRLAISLMMGCFFATFFAAIILAIWGF